MDETEFEQIEAWVGLDVGKADHHGRSSQQRASRCFRGVRAAFTVVVNSQSTRSRNKSGARERRPMRPYTTAKAIAGNRFASGI
jgi:ribosomal protein S13